MTARGRRKEKRARLCEGSPQAHHGGGRPRVGVVLHVDDLAVPQSEGLRPGVPLPVRARPGERDYDPVATRLDGVETVGAVADFPPFRYPPSENLTGLVGAASGGWPQRLPQPAAAPPLHVRVNQRDERLDVTFSERLVRGANRVDGHPRQRTPGLRSGPCQPSSLNRSSPARSAATKRASRCRPTPAGSSTTAPVAASGCDPRRATAACFAPSAQRRARRSRAAADLLLLR
jgi:hypothetical protein